MCTRCKYEYHTAVYCRVVAYEHDEPAKTKASTTARPRRDVVKVSKRRRCSRVKYKIPRSFRSEHILSGRQLEPCVLFSRRLARSALAHLLVRALIAATGCCFCAVCGASNRSSDSITFGGHKVDKQPQKTRATAG